MSSDDVIEDKFVGKFSDLPFSAEYLNLSFLRERISLCDAPTSPEWSLLPVDPPAQVDVCIFHAPCSDGSAAAFAVSKKFGDNCSFYGVNRGSGDTDCFLPTYKIDGSHVLLVDYVYSEPLMRELIERAASVTVIDHHVSELPLLRDVLGFSIFDPDCAAENEMTTDFAHSPLKAIYSSKVSACILTWKWFFPSEPVPILFAYINDNDVGEWKLSNIGNFVSGFCVDSSVLRPGWSEFYHFQPFREALNMGPDFIRSRILLGMIAKQIEWRDVYAEAQRCADKRLKVAPQYICRVLNVSPTSSSGLLFRSLLSGEYLYDESWDPKPPADIALHYFFIDSNGSWKCSLRSSHGDVNVGEIASKLGGGGHACAASFTLYGDFDDLFLPDTTFIDN